MSYYRGWVWCSVRLVTVTFALMLSESAVAGEAVCRIEETIRLLKDGNARYVAGRGEHPHQDRAQREATTARQQVPLATVVACSDSQVPVEILFDCGIGDLFVVRVPGNVINADELAAIEFGAGHLRTPIVLILGHTRCEVANAAVNTPDLYSGFPKMIRNIRLAAIRLKSAHPELRAQELVEEAIKSNLLQSVQDILKNSAIIRKRVTGKRLKLLSAVYNSETGQVEWLGDDPQQLQGVSYR